MTNKVQMVWAGVAILILAAVAAFLFKDRLTLAGNADVVLLANNATVVAQGQQIYEANCAACHGRNLEGQPDWRNRDADGYLPAPPHDENGHTWHHKDALLFGITKFGIVKYAGDPNYRTRMPAYEDVLSDEQIVAVLSYIKSRWPAEIQARHDQLNAQ